MSASVTAPGLDALIVRLEGVRSSTNGSYIARCPSHDDSSPSLSVSVGDNGRVLVHCFAGCSPEQITAALGLEMTDLFPTAERTNGHQHHAEQHTRYQIRNVDGEAIAIHERVDAADGSKRFAWWRPGHDRPGLDGLNTADLPLYGSEHLADKVDGTTVIVTEGEKAADALGALGVLCAVLATTCGAAVTPSDDVLATVAHFDVVLWPDNDDAGRAHMARIAARLAALGCTPRWFTWLDAPPKGDAAEWTGTLMEMVEAIDEAPLWSETTADEFPHSSDSDPRVVAESGRTPSTPSWPDQLGPAAFHGLAGEIIQAFQPYSEADPAALLAHLLCGVSALVDRHVHAVAGDAIHPAKLNAIVVGATSKGRKGSAARPVERLLEKTDETFQGRIMEGLSSGEGLIWQCHDAIKKVEMVGHGPDRHSEEVTTDSGVTDKRLWVIESEFATTLRMVERDGNTLSAIIRRAWDRDDLRTLTKNNPATATGAHIAVTGHVSKEELLRYLDRSEMANGFVNRFLVFAAARGRLLPDGERVPDEVIERYASRLRAVVEWAQTPRRLVRDAECRDTWHAVYGALSEGKPGLLGAATNRAEAQVLRLCVVFAVLDRSEYIRAAHLTAALAVWHYCEQSAAWVFGDAVGDPVADSILSALRQAGEMTRTEIVDSFGRHVGRGRLDKALTLLMTGGLVRRETMPSGGRPTEVWRAA